MKWIPSRVMKRTEGKKGGGEKIPEFLVSSYRVKATSVGVLCARQLKIRTFLSSLVSLFFFVLSLLVACSGQRGSDDKPCDTLNLFFLFFPSRHAEERKRETRLWLEDTDPGTKAKTLVISLFLFHGRGRDIWQTLAVHKQKIAPARMTRSKIRICCAFEEKGRRRKKIWFVEASVCVTTPCFICQMQIACPNSCSTNCIIVSIVKPKGGENKKKITSRILVPTWRKIVVRNPPLLPKSRYLLALAELRGRNAILATKLIALLLFQREKTNFPRRTW